MMFASGTMFLIGAIVDTVLLVKVFYYLDSVFSVEFKSEVLYVSHLAVIYF